MKKHELKFGSGKKKIHSVNLDIGLVEKTKEMYHGNLSHHIEILLDQWCQDKDESNRVHQIVQETMADLKKAGSVMPEKEAIKMLLHISEERKKELLNDPKSKALMKELDQNSPTQTKEQKENSEKLLKDFKEKISTKEGGKS